jgi:hypothetical protein
MDAYAKNDISRPSSSARFSGGMLLPSAHIHRKGDMDKLAQCWLQILK